MERYLVGGAVRDALLGRPVTDRDWVVVGTTPAALRRAGYLQVGRDFPVFLHPETKEEHALARTERKTGRGHQGFEVHAGEEVTLTEDLARRDLTVNAIAQAEDGSFVDPYGGRDDLARRLLRHVSPAFAEDPLRVFRCARFAAQLAGYGFTVAPATMTLMQRMARAGALAELSAERVWQETERALSAARPVRYFEVLRDADALGDWFAPWEDAGDAAWAALRQADELEPIARYAALCTPLSGELAEQAGRRLKAPRDWSTLGRLNAAFGATLATWHQQAATVLLDALAGADAWRRPERFAQLMRLVQVVRPAPSPITPILEVAARLAALRPRPGVTGPDIPADMRAQRIAVVGELLADSSDPVP